MKIPTEEFTEETLAIDDTYEDGVVVMVMEVDKVADELTDKIIKSTKIMITIIDCCTHHYLVL